MQLFNSLTKRLEELKPIEDKRVVMYVCGLTPYDAAHIGHARTYVSFDTFKRYLMRKGYSVYHIQNITDVEDKIIKRCMETGADPMQLTSHTHDEAMELFSALHILPADVYPKVTEHMPDIIAFVQLLLDKGHAYETESGIYFDVMGFKGYGSLSGQDIEQMKAGVRKDVAEGKRSHLDFALWKRSKGEILEFDSPWGRGRPGWHIECSALAKRYGKRTLDIHGGARDLIFPHHENEIAQSEAATGERFCNLWLHTGFLTVNGEKMSKSLGNFITIKQALSQFPPNALRLFYLQANYRSPLDYEEEKIAAMGESVERIFNSRGLIRELDEGPGAPDEDFRKQSQELIDSFYSSMEADLNTPEAIAALFSLLRLANSHLSSGHPDRERLKELEKEIDGMLWILGIEEERKGLDDKAGAISGLLSELGGTADTPEDALDVIIGIRDKARADKDYARSDMIRARLKDIGIILEDKQGGIRWRIA